MGLVWVRLALHEGVKEARAAGLQTNNGINDTLVRVGRVFMLHMRVRHEQRCQAFNNAWIFNDRSHRDMRRLYRLDTGHASDALEELLKRRYIRREVR